MIPWKRFLRKNYAIWLIPKVYCSVEVWNEWSRSVFEKRDVDTYSIHKHLHLSHQLKQSSPKGTGHPVLLPVGGREHRLARCDKNAV